MNTTIKNAIIRKRITRMSSAISLNTHLISRRIKPYMTTMLNNDHAATLTFVSSHIHTITHTNLTTIFMLIPEVRLSFCFVCSFFFPMTFFFAASVSSADFCFVLAAKGQRCDVIGKFFAQNTLARRERGRFFAKPFRA